ITVTQSISAYIQRCTGIRHLSGYIAKPLSLSGCVIFPYEIKIISGKIAAQCCCGSYVERCFIIAADEYITVFCNAGSIDFIVGCGEAGFAGPLPRLRKRDLRNKSEQEKREKFFHVFGSMSYAVKFIR